MIESPTFCRKNNAFVRELRQNSLKKSDIILLGLCGPATASRQTFHHANQSHQIPRLKHTASRGLAQKVVRLSKVGEGARDLSGRTLTVQVPNPLHTTINTGVHYRQPAPAIRVKRVNNLEF